MILQDWDITGWGQRKQKQHAWPWCNLLGTFQGLKPISSYSTPGTDLLESGSLKMFDP